MGLGGFEGGWRGQPKPEKFCHSEGRTAELGPVLKGWCNGPSGLLAWSWQSRCVVACTLLLPCRLHCAMLTDPVQVSPMSCDPPQSPSWRLWVCLWSVSSGLHDSTLQSAVLRREGAWVVICQPSWWHVQPSGVVTCGAWWRCWTFLSARESLCRALCPATSLSVVEMETVEFLCMPLVDSPGLTGIK